MIEVVDKADNKRRKILSAGKSRWGLLGQGNDIEESNLFKEIKINFGLITITHIDLAQFHAMAISKEGTLYAWGNHDKVNLGLEKKEKKNVYYTPTPVSFFEKYNVKHLSLIHI